MPTAVVTGIGSSEAFGSVVTFAPNTAVVHGIESQEIFGFSGAYISPPPVDLSGVNMAIAPYAVAVPSDIDGGHEALDDDLAKCATVHSMTETLNDMTTFEVEVGSDERGFWRWLGEGQIWRTKDTISRCLGTGVVVRMELSGDTTTMSLVDPSWYLHRRTIGPGTSTDFSVNGDFSSGTSGWMVSPGGTCDFAVGVFLPDNLVSARLYGAINEGNNFIEQQLNINATHIYVSAEFYIEGFLGPAADNRGLYANYVRGTGDSAESISLDVSEIDHTTPTGVWTPVEVQVDIPKLDVNTWTLLVRCYAPNGWIHWRNVVVGVDEGLDIKQSDQAWIFHDLVLDGQSEWGYDDRNITTDLITTGVKRDRYYAYTDDINIYDDAIKSFNDLYQGLDHGFYHPNNDPTVRKLQCWYPTRGTYAGTNYKLTNNEVELQSLTDSLDGEAANNSVVIKGEGSGPVQRRKKVKDLSKFVSFTTEADFEMRFVTDAKPESKPWSLREEALELVRTIPCDLSLTIIEPTMVERYMFDITVGDRVPIQLLFGWIDINTRMRVVQRILNFDDNTVTVSLNFDPNLDPTRLA